MRAYVIFAGGKQSGIITNQQVAKRQARQVKGEVRAISWSYYKECSSWDYPTFYAVSDRIADYRQTA